MERKNGIKADVARSYRAIEQAALHWRTVLETDLLEPLDCLDVFDFRLGDISIPSAIGNVRAVEHVSPCQEEGLTRWDNDSQRLEVVLSELTHSNLLDGLARAKFTMCHEFGHAVLHTNELIRLAGLPIEGKAAMHRRKEYPTYFDSEWQANAFAGAFLMPAIGVQKLMTKYGYISEDLVSDHFQVSLVAARYRLESMTKI